MYSESRIKLLCAHESGIIISFQLEKSWKRQLSYKVDGLVHKVYGQSHCSQLQVSH